MEIAYLLAAIIGGVFYFTLKYFVDNRHISGIKLTNITDQGIQELVESMVNFLNEVNGVNAKPPRVKIADLSSENVEYNPSGQAAAIYDYKLKMIFIDANYMRSLDNNIKTLARYVSHEWKHYSDHLEGITYNSAGVEICEERARSFEVRGMKSIVRNLEW